MTKLDAYIPPAAAAKPLSPMELLASLRSALTPWTPGTPFWIFAYGSLMWNPSFTFDVRHVATIATIYRSFRVWSRINRGTPDKRLRAHARARGSCRGTSIASIPTSCRTQMNLIWKREMNFGSYCPKWLNCTVSDETIRARLHGESRMLGLRGPASDRGDGRGRSRAPRDGGKGPLAVRRAARHLQPHATPVACVARRWAIQYSKYSGWPEVKESLMAGASGRLHAPAARDGPGGPGSPLKIVSWATAPAYDHGAQRLRLHDLPATEGKARRDSQPLRGGLPLPAADAPKRAWRRRTSG